MGNYVFSGLQQGTAVNLDQPGLPGRQTSVIIPIFRSAFTDISYHRLIRLGRCLGLQTSRSGKHVMKMLVKTSCLSWIWPGNPLNKAVSSHEIRIISTSSGLGHSSWSQKKWVLLIGKGRGDGQSKTWSLQLWIFRPEGKKLVPKLTERSIPDLTFSHPEDSSCGWSREWLSFY